MKGCKTVTGTKQPLRHKATTKRRKMTTNRCKQLQRIQNDHTATQNKHRENTEKYSKYRDVEWSGSDVKQLWWDTKQQQRDAKWPQTQKNHKDTKKQLQGNTNWPQSEWPKKRCKWDERDEKQSTMRHETTTKRCSLIKKWHKMNTKTTVVTLLVHNLSSFCLLLTIAVTSVATVLHFWLIFFHSSCRQTCPVQTNTGKTVLLSSVGLWWKVLKFLRIMKRKTKWQLYNVQS